MTALIGAAIALIATGLVHGVASERKVGNFTLTRCPEGGKTPNCAKLEKPEVVFPADDYEEPGYKAWFGYYIVDFTAEHRLTWDKDDDDPRNLTISIGDYRMMKEITTGRELNFTFIDLAWEILPDTDPNDVIEMVIGVGMNRPSSNAMGFERLGPPFNSSSLITIKGIKDFYILPGTAYSYVQNGMDKQRERTEDKLTKKWRIGVGDGDGVGVPLLMGLSYFLGTRKGKKKHLSAKEASHE